MASKLLRSSGYAKFAKCAYATVTPPATVTSPAAIERADLGTPLSDGMLISKLSNNALVITAQPDRPVSAITFVYKSGSRYEHADNAGVAQLIRLCGGMKTTNVTAFMHARVMQQAGANVKVIGGRETIQYTMTGIIHDNVMAAWDPISQISGAPLFRQWEVDEVIPRLKLEKSLMTPSFKTMDLLHKAAFQSKGLGRSILSPDYMLDNLDADDLMEFHTNTHTLDRLSVIGLGCNHVELTEAAKELTHTANGTAIVKSVYRGGQERRDDGNRCAYVAIAGNGASIQSPDYINLLVAESILGGTFTKNGIDPCSKLANILSKTDGKGEVYPINVNYSDVGLFGMFIIIEPQHVEQVIKKMFTGFKNIKITEEDVTAAKIRTKYRLLMENEGIESQAEWVAAQIQSTTFATILDLCNAIDKTTAASVQAALKKVTSSKMSMSACGNIDEVPYLEFL